MTPNQQTHFKKRLQLERRGIQSILASHRPDPHFEESDPSAKPVHLHTSKRGTGSANQQISGATAIREKERLLEIDAALERIDSDAYGICERCGNDISLEVLEEAPIRRTCMRCGS